MSPDPATPAPRRPISGGRVWLILLGGAVAYVLTPARVVIDAGWDVLTSKWFWIVVGGWWSAYLTVIVLRWLYRAARGTARAGRHARERHAELRDLRKERAPAHIYAKAPEGWDAFDDTLDDIRSLPETPGSPDGAHD